MRGAEDDEDGLFRAFRLRERLIRSTVGMPTSVGTCVGSSNSDDVPIALRRADTFLHQFAEFAQLLGIRSARENGRAHGIAFKLSFFLGAHSTSRFVFEESRLVQRVVKIALDIADLDAACQTHKIGAQVKGGVLSVEAIESRNQRHRDHESGV